MISDFSPIQNHILSQLKNATLLRYSDLRPSEVPNDLFNYHLQQLVKKGLVEKQSSGYCLSHHGIQHVADPYLSNDAITSLFKINVITIVSRQTEKGVEILNQVRKSNPSYGKVGVMGGVVLKGEPITHAASRKLRQETGLTASFRLVGCERRIMYKSGNIFSDVMFPITYADTSSGKLLEDSPFGHNMWVPIEDAITNESAEFDSIVTIPKILNALKDGSLDTLPFIFNENIQDDSNYLKET